VSILLHSRLTHTGQNSNSVRWHPNFSSSNEQSICMEDIFAV
jgi:hypothetical protein